MPYASDRQRRFFHTESARRAGITAAMVREFDAASKGRDLPERAEKIGNAYGMPKLPTPPKSPTLAAGAAPRAVGGYRGVPPLAQGPRVHKPLANLQAQATQRAANSAAQSTGAKLGKPDPSSGSTPGAANGAASGA